MVTIWSSAISRVTVLTIRSPGRHTMAPGSRTPWAGVFERINAYVLMAWLVVLAVTVIHRRVERTTGEHGAMDGPQTRSLPRERAMAASR
jgi:hypothetical protein